MIDSLALRHEDYEDSYKYIITKRLPIVIRANLRNFKKLTQYLTKPYCPEFIDILSNTMLYVITEIQDALFGYCYKDEIIFILRNDKELNYEPWYQNDVQKISSVISSLCTIGYYRSVDLFSHDLNIVGEGVFHTKVFALPYIGEVINYLIWHQNNCIKSAMNSVVYFELSEKFDKQTVTHLVQDKTCEEKSNILLRNCGITFEEYYPLNFIRGTAAYKVPTIIPSKNGDFSKNKWALNNVPDFLRDKDFLYNILTNGIDVFRANNISNGLGD